MAEQIYQIYDKTFKKILTLSTRAVINLINGLFDTNYPIDSTIQYNWTEFEDDKLKRILADTIVTINGRDSYHMEAQMTKDDDIVFRVFEYGFSHANRNHVQEGEYYRLDFPEPKVIYLSPDGKVPSRYILELRFGNQGTFRYTVDTVVFNEISVEELNRKKMIILIPFKLLKLQKIVEKKRTPDNLEALKYLIRHDIIDMIEENLRLDNITVSDAGKLKRLTQNLYQQIYAKYEELEEMPGMTDESIMFDIDILEKKYEEAFAEQDKALKEKDKALEAMSKENAELRRQIQELKNRK